MMLRTVLENAMKKLWAEPHPLTGVYILHFLAPEIRVQNWPSKKQVVHVVVQKPKFQNILKKKIEKKIFEIFFFDFFTDSTHSISECPVKTTLRPVPYGRGFW